MECMEYRFIKCQFEIRVSYSGIVCCPVFSFESAFPNLRVASWKDIVILFLADGRTAVAAIIFTLFIIIAVATHQSTTAGS